MINPQDQTFAQIRYLDWRACANRVLPVLAQTLRFTPAKLSIAVRGHFKPGSTIMLWL